MRPSPGRIVLVFAGPGFNDGPDHAPAVITRVWGDGLINARVLWNGPAMPPPGRRDWLQHIPLYPDRDTAELAHLERRAAVPGEHRPPPADAAWWPPRL